MRWVFKSMLTNEMGFQKDADQSEDEFENRLVHTYINICIDAEVRLNCYRKYSPMRISTCPNVDSFCTLIDRPDHFVSNIFFPA